MKEYTFTTGGCHLVRRLSFFEIYELNYQSSLNIELQMRRPNKGRYRLDKLLERKAKEGVKIYVIL